MKEVFELYCDDWRKSATKIIIEIDLEYNYGINFLIETDGFKGAGPLYLLKEDIPLYLDQLETMNRTLKGGCRITDADTGEFFIDASFKEGQLVLTGLISNYSQKLTFQCNVDQTILNPIILILKKLNKR